MFFLETHLIWSFLYTMQKLNEMGVAHTHTRARIQQYL